jgi:urease beta subunit
MCTVQVGFSPATVGTLQASLTFSDDAANSAQVVAVSGNGIQPAVSLSTSTIAFGNQVVGTTSASQSVVVTNSGMDTLNVAAATVAAPFAIVADTCSNKAVSAGSSCTIQVNFAPAGAGPFTGTLAIPDDAPGSPHSVALTGTGINPHATASPSSIAFGDVRAGMTASQSATLTNDGTTTVHVGTTTLTGEAIFSLSADTCSGVTLAVGSACTVQVNFVPLASSGPYQLATLAFNDDANNTPQTVALSGHAVQPSVSLSASSLAFGNQLVGTTSASQSIVVTNAGSATLNVGSASTSAPFAIVTDGCSNTAVTAGSSCTVQLAFTPMAAGAASGTLSIPDDAGGSPQTVALSGTGLQPHVTASPGAISFGGVRVGNAAAAQTITLTNDGNTTVHVSTATLAGDSSFSVAANSCSGATLVVGAACTVQVGFAPANVGSFTATVSFNDDASNSPQTLAVSGTGVYPAVSLSASSLSFGNQLVGTRSANQSIVVTNSGSGTLNIGTASVGAPYAIGADACSNSAVAPGSTCTIQINFAPSVTGPASGNISISDDASGSPHTVALSGTGVQARATVSPSSLSFGSVRVGPGTAGAQQYVTITNSGTADLHLASTVLAGDPAFTIGTTCPVTTLAPGASCKIGIYASPDTIGSRSATLQLSDDAPGSPQTVPLSVTGLDGKLTATPTSINFGSVKVNNKSSKLTIKVQNTGNATLAIGTVSIAGPNSTSFVIDSNSCAGKQLAVGATCSLTVYMKPQATGTLSASLTLANDGLGGKQYVALTGTGTR